MLEPLNGRHVMNTELIHQVLKITTSRQHFGARVSLSFEELHRLPAETLDERVVVGLSQILSRHVAQALLVNESLKPVSKEEPGTNAVEFSTEFIVLSPAEWSSVSQFIRLAAREAGYDPFKYYDGG